MASVFVRVSFERSLLHLVGKLLVTAREDVEKEVLTGSSLYAANVVLMGMEGDWETNKFVGTSLHSGVMARVIVGQI